MAWINDVLEFGKDVKGLVQEVVESTRRLPPEWDPRFMASTVMMSSHSFPGHLHALMHDHVVRGAEMVPVEVFHKRVEEFRKKHPDTMEPLEKMHEIVYGTKEWETKTEKIKEITRPAEGGGIFRIWERLIKETMDKTALDALVDNLEGDNTQTATEARGGLSGEN